MNNEYVVVIGDVIEDVYHICDVDRLDQTSSIPIAKVKYTKHLPGGAANVAASLVNMGVPVKLIGGLCSPHSGERLDIPCTYGHADLECDNLGGCLRSIKTRIVDQYSRVISRFDEDIVNNDDSIAQIEHYIQDMRCTVIVICDYGRLLSPRAIRRIMEIARFQDVIVDPCISRPAQTYAGATVITPNLTQLIKLSGMDSGVSVPAKAATLSQITRSNVLVTCGAEGTIYKCGRLAPVYNAAITANVANTIGAGDAVIAGLVFGRYCRNTWAGAIKWGLAAAACSVEDPLTHTCTLAEVILKAKKFGGVPAITQIDLLKRITKEYNFYRRPTVVVNGVFDILHAGHFALFKKARELAGSDGIVIALLNSDASTTRQKGATRPVNCLGTRAERVVESPDVDLVGYFDEDTPTEAICALDPQYLVKGEQYRGSIIPGAAFVEDIVFVPMVGTSTTKILKDCQCPTPKPY